MCISCHPSACLSIRSDRSPLCAYGNYLVLVELLCITIGTTGVSIDFLYATSWSVRYTSQVKQSVVSDHWYMIALSALSISFLFSYEATIYYAGKIGHISCNCSNERFCKICETQGHSRLQSALSRRIGLPKRRKRLRSRSRRTKGCTPSKQNADCTLQESTIAFRSRGVSAKSL